METSTLRWILVIIGVVIVGAIFLFGNPDKKRKLSESEEASEEEESEGSNVEEEEEF